MVFFWGVFLYKTYLACKLRVSGKEHITNVTFMK